MIITEYMENGSLDMFLRVRLCLCVYTVCFYTLKNAGLFQPKFGSNMDKPKFWVKNLIEKC